jgi:flagellar biosynthetic protein FliQ
MEALDIMDVGRDSLWLMLKITLPILLVALVVGLVISLFQALTQIQEMTLSFVPKIVSIFFAILLMLPYIGGQLDMMFQDINKRIITIEKSKEADGQ